MQQNQGKAILYSCWNTQNTHKEVQFSSGVAENMETESSRLCTAYILTNQKRNYKAQPDNEQGAIKKHMSRTTPAPASDKVS